jgi:hypothetical protein
MPAIFPTLINEDVSEAVLNSTKKSKMKESPGSKIIGVNSNVI